MRRKEGKGGTISNKNTHELIIVIGRNGTFGFKILF